MPFASRARVGAHSKADIQLKRPAFNLVSEPGEQALTVRRAVTGAFKQTREQVDGDGAVTVRERTPPMLQPPPL